LREIIKPTKPKEASMKQVELKKVKAGDWFKRKETSQTVFVRDKYCRSTRKIECQDWFDINRFVSLKPSTMVWVDFEF